MPVSDILVGLAGLIPRWIAWMMPVLGKIARMKMDGACFMMDAFMNADKHALHRTSGQEGPCQNQYYKRGK